MRQQLAEQEAAAAQLAAAKESAEAAVADLRRELSQAQGLASKAQEEAAAALQQAEELEAQKQQLRKVGGCHACGWVPLAPLFRAALSCVHVCWVGCAPTLLFTPSSLCLSSPSLSVQALEAAESADLELQAARVEREELKAKVGACLLLPGRRASAPLTPPGAPPSLPPGVHRWALTWR